MSSFEEQAKVYIKETQERLKIAAEEKKTQKSTSATIEEESTGDYVDSDLIAMTSQAYAISGAVGLTTTDEIRTMIYKLYFKYREDMKKDEQTIVQFYIKPLFENSFRMLKLAAEEKLPIQIALYVKLIFQMINLFNQYKLYEHIIPGLSILPVVNNINQNPRLEEVRKKLLKSNAKQLMRFYIVAYTSFHTKLYTMRLSKEKENEMKEFVMPFHQNIGLDHLTWKETKKSAFDQILNVGCLRNYHEFIIPLING